MRNLHWTDGKVQPSSSINSNFIGGLVFPYAVPVLLMTIWQGHSCACCHVVSLPRPPGNWIMRQLLLSKPAFHHQMVIPQVIIQA